MLCKTLMSLRFGYHLSPKRLAGTHSNMAKDKPSTDAPLSQPEAAVPLNDAKFPFVPKPPGPIEKTRFNESTGLWEAVPPESSPNAQATTP